MFHFFQDLPNRAFSAPPYNSIQFNLQTFCVNAVSTCVCCGRLQKFKYFALAKKKKKKKRGTRHLILKKKLENKKNHTKISNEVDSIS